MEVEAHNSRRFVLTLLRHGESVGNAESRWQGRSDFPLTDAGRAQVHALAERWRAENMVFDLILTSTLKRAVETAEIIGAALHVPVEQDPMWLERDVGSLAGLRPAEVRERLPDGIASSPFEAISGDGEGDWQLFLRAGQALHGILQRPSGSYLVVSHGGILNATMHAVLGITPRAHASGVRFRLANTGFARILYSAADHRWEIDALNDHAHWSDGRTVAPEA